MSTHPLISLVFVNYHSFWHLSCALESLFSKEGKPGQYEVIIVNNDSREQLALEQLVTLFSGVRVITSINQGFGAGANKGAKLSHGKILGFINPDVFWCVSILDKIGEYFQKNQNQILGLTLLSENNKIEYLGEDRVPSLWQLIQSNLWPRFVKKTDQLEWVSGGGLFVNESSFWKVGGFDEGFFLYFEDVDFCLRARRANIGIQRQEQLALIHKGGKSFSSGAEQKKYFFQSQARYYEKYRNVLERATLKFLQGIFCSSRL